MKPPDDYPPKSKIILPDGSKHEARVDFKTDFETLMKQALGSRYREQAVNWELAENWHPADFTLQEAADELRENAAAVALLDAISSVFKPEPNEWFEVLTAIRNWRQVAVLNAALGKPEESELSDIYDFAYMTLSAYLTLISGRQPKPRVDYKTNPITKEDLK